MRSTSVVAALVLVLAGVAAGERKLNAVTETPQVSIPYTNQYLDPMAPLPIDSPIFDRNVTGLDPEQVSDEMWGYWVLWRPLLCSSAQTWLEGLTPPWCLQIHITYNSPTSVTISWATGEGLQFAKPVTSYVSDDGIQSEVYYGTMSGMYSNNATG